jgi:hypothetical protein
MSKNISVKTEKMYLCYYYYDYRNEFEINALQVFAELEKAISYAHNLSDNEENVKAQYVNQRGKHYDAIESDSIHGRIAVDSVDTHFIYNYNIEKVKPGTPIYVIYRYKDSIKENTVLFHSAFDDEENALRLAAEMGDGKESKPNYVNHAGELFDQNEKDSSYWRIAVDQVTVG